MLGRMRGSTMPLNSLSEIRLRTRWVVGENLLLTCLLEKFTNFCFSAKGACVWCIGFEVTHDYGGWQATSLFKCLDHCTRFSTYLNAILTILTLVSCSWIRFLLVVAFGDPVAIIFTVNIATGSLLVLLFTTSARIPLLCYARLGFFFFYLKTSCFY